jgi:hypothetical protein
MNLFVITLLAFCLVLFIATVASSRSILRKLLVSRTQAASLTFIAGHLFGILLGALLYLLYPFLVAFGLLYFLWGTIGMSILAALVLSIPRTRKTEVPFSEKKRTLKRIVSISCTPAAALLLTLEVGLFLSIAIPANYEASLRRHAMETGLPEDVERAFKYESERDTIYRDVAVRERDTARCRYMHDASYRTWCVRSIEPEFYNSRTECIRSITYMRDPLRTTAHQCLMQNVLEIVPRELPPEACSFHHMDNEILTIIEEKCAG